MESNVHLFEVEGTSDELDVSIKECFPADGLACVNAINWARIMIQVGLL
jgi:threonine synthase